MEKRSQNGSRNIFLKDILEGMSYSQIAKKFDTSVYNVANFVYFLKQKGKIKTRTRLISKKGKKIK
ncbi:MAG TPA: hypothetical protein VNG53_02115 [Bacteroidia bacterium]|nr:hypothetical protein [Bacteroidia bacterium]